MTDDEIKATLGDAQDYLLANPDLLDSHARRFARALVALADRKQRVPDDKKMTQVVANATIHENCLDCARGVIYCINAELERRGL